MDCLDMDKSSYAWVPEEGCAVDSSAGTLVWVRRRNGHWWPGRVLAAHEVSRSHLLVPKSGTPVKLLGKDDASVDWYNFGKSRRIKAFRCGEFDDCIERARSFGCLRSKNREKYARREDAILHALELEKRHAEGMQNSERSLSAAAILDSPVFTQQVPLKNDPKCRNHGNSHAASLESRRCTFVQASEVSNSNGGPTRLRPSINIDMDNGVPQAIPRMRGLQDFGLQVTNTNASNTRYKNVFEAHAENVSCSYLPCASLTEDGNNMESCITRLTAGVCSAPSVSKSSLAIVQKRKKHPTSSSADECPHKKRDRRRPLTQVLKKSSNKAAVLGSKTSDFPLSTADCRLHVYCSEGTEATSSQDTFQQEIDEFRPISEQRGCDFLPTDYASRYGLKQYRGRLLTTSDTTLTSFWSNYWDNGRWPSLVSAHMDFGLLLGSSYTDSTYKGTKSATCLPTVAYTGSATSVNTSDIHKPDTIGIETHDSKSTDCAEKDVLGLQKISKWQAKKRRNKRKSRHCLGVEHIGDDGSFLRNDGVDEGQSRNARQMLLTKGSTYMRPLREKRLNLLVNKSDAPSMCTTMKERKVISQRVCFMNSSFKKTLSCDTRRPGFQWVNLRVGFDEGNESVGGELVSLFSEVLNRAVAGYPVSVQVLGSRAGRFAKADSVRQISSTRLIGCPKHKKPPNQHAERDPVRKARSKYRAPKPARKSGSALQKTRTLSSLALTDFSVGKAHCGMRGSRGDVPSSDVKNPLVTCVSVHLVFQRIREVLYKKQPDNGSLKESCEEMAADGEC